MEIVQYIFVGVIAGLIVASWHSFKDPPWEGFHLTRFCRSLISGGVIGLLLYVVQNARLIAVSNLGQVGLAVVCLERLWGETLKGSIKKKAHAEYIPVFNKYKFPYNNYILKFLVGIILSFLVCLLLFYYVKLPFVLNVFIKNRILLGMLCGLIGGFTVALGGSLKDSPAEGFKPTKFIRSPLVGMLGGMLIISFTKQLDLLIISVIGFERIGVEFYKTFYTRSKRGIFDGKEVINQGWFNVRWFFFATYLMAVFYTFFNLIFQK